MTMHKEDLVRLHELMAEISEYFDDDAFTKYEDLDIDPDDIHESKNQHQEALLVLGEEIADTMSDNDFSETGRIRKRLEELIEDQ
ncbi:MAG: UPF0058 family protein [Halobacteriaceae archaeon]